MTFIALLEEIHSSYYILSFLFNKCSYLPYMRAFISIRYRVHTRIPSFGIRGILNTDRHYLTESNKVVLPISPSCEDAHQRFSADSLVAYRSQDRCEPPRFDPAMRIKSAIRKRDNHCYLTRALSLSLSLLLTRSFVFRTMSKLAEHRHQRQVDAKFANSVPSMNIKRGVKRNHCPLPLSDNFLVAQ